MFRPPSFRSSPDQPSRWWWRPFVFLALAFVTELAIMQGLPLLLPQLPWWQLAALDAGLLTVLLAAPAWLLFVVPLERLSTARGRLLHRMLSIQEEEQERITRDLHDGIGQSLTAMLMQLRLMQSEPLPPTVDRQLVDLRTLVGSTVEELRRMVREGRPPVLSDLGLQPALQQRFASFVGNDDFSIRFDWRLPEASRLPPAVETAIYRIVGEAVTNAAKHAGASTVQVMISRCVAGVQAQIVDDGRGFVGRPNAAADRQSFGILGMRERASALGGSLRIESQPGRGTTVEVIIPCDGAGHSSLCCLGGEESADG